MASSLRSESFPTLDGRVARGRRTRESILRAYESLIVDAAAPPTGAELARSAGVSARSIFTHFGDMDGVLAAAARRAFDWIVETHVDVPVELPIEERLRRFTVRFAEILERTAPLYRMVRSFQKGGRRDVGSPAVQEILQGVDQLRRNYICFVFGRELDALDAAGRADTIEALMVSSSWNTWEGLRVEQDLEIDRSREVLHRILSGLLPA